MSNHEEAMLYEQRMIEEALPSASDTVDPTSADFPRPLNQS